MNAPVTTQPARPQSMRPFFVIWSGQAFSLFGSQLVQFALVWWLTRTTGSATTLALATMMAILPEIFAGPFAGALVDRWNRRIVMMVADGAIALATVALAVLFGLRVVQVWHIYAAMLIRSTGGAFHWPAMQASTTLLVPEKHLSRVAGLNQALWGLAGIMMPPLGALLLQLLPMQGILAIDVGTAMLAIVPLLFIQIPQPTRPEAPGRAGQRVSFTLSVLADMRDGLRFVWGWKGLTILIGIFMSLNLLTWPAGALVPILVTRHFGGGKFELAWFQAVLGIGSIVGGLTLSLWGGFKRRVTTMMLALILDGAGIAVIGLTPAAAFLLAICAGFLAGFMASIVNSTAMAIVQATVPPDVQGRVLALVTSGVRAVTPLGLAIAGPVADALGTPIWFLIGGTATAVMGTGSFFIPALMRIEDKATVQAG